MLIQSKSLAAFRAWLYLDRNDGSWHGLKNQHSLVASRKGRFEAIRLLREGMQRRRTSTFRNYEINEPRHPKERRGWEWEIIFLPCLKFFEAFLFDFVFPERLDQLQKLLLVILFSENLRLLCIFWKQRSTNDEEKSSRALSHSKIFYYSLFFIMTL